MESPPQFIDLRMHQAKSAVTRFVPVDVPALFKDKRNLLVQVLTGYAANLFVYRIIPIYAGRDASYNEAHEAFMTLGVEIELQPHFSG